MTQTKKTGLGIIGCGNISTIYIQNLRDRFPGLELRAVADIIPERATARAEEFHIPQACTVEQILADPAIELIVNLTIPPAHHGVCKAALDAGKHVYVEKPLSITLQEGEELVGLARQKGLLLGGAPDTFLGAGIQTCLKLIQDGWLGTVVGATAFMLCGGHESWHPDPGFYYQRGGGPLYDMGPYYLSALTALLGPVQSLSGLCSTTWKERVITSQPKHGNIMVVDVPTHVSGLLQFKNGAQASICTSFDVKGGHSHVPLEIYGTEGSLQVPDPNTFGGPIRYRRAGTAEWTEIPLLKDWEENSRGLGVADMADALKTGRQPRASGDLTLHVLEIMHGIHQSAEHKTWYTVRNQVEKPEAL